MMQTLRTLMKAGLGAIDLTEEKLRGVFDELVRRGEVTEKDATHLLATWKTRAAERHETLATQIRAIVREELKAQHVPRRDELETLAQHVARVERQVIPVEEVPAR